MNNLERLGSNIRSLRRAYGETQEELGIILNVEKNAISNYEKGIRQPNNDLLGKMAEHFCITVEELLQSDLSSIGEIQYDNNAFLKEISTTLPIFSSEQAMKNETFCKAYKAHKKMYDLLSIGCLDEFDNIDICLEGYLDCENIFTIRYESISNFISLYYLIMLLFSSARVFNNQSALLNKLAKKDKKVRKVVESIDPSFISESEEIYNLFLNDEELQEKLLEFKCTLKKSYKWAELADYYLMLQYIWNIVDNDLSLEFNKRIGVEMLMNLITVKNKYAARLYINMLKAGGIMSSQIVDDKS